MKHNIKKLTALLVLLIAAILLPAAAYAATGADPAPEFSASFVEAPADSHIVLDTVTNKTQHLTLSYSGTAVPAMPPAAVTELKWSSSDEAVATVEQVGAAEAGIVTAVGEGSAIISCEVTITDKSDPNAPKTWTDTATCTVKVRADAPKVHLDGKHFVLVVGDSVKPASSHDSDIYGTLSLSADPNDNTIIKLDPDGTVTAIAEGTATISATATLNGVTSDPETCTIHVITAAPTAAIEGDTALTVGEVKSLRSTITPAGEASWGSWYRTEWTSSDRAVAEITDNGTVTAKAAGNTTITVTHTVKTYAEATPAVTATTSVEVTVTAPDLVSISITPSYDPYTLKHTSEQLTLVPNPATASVTDVVWTSSDETVATVDASGVVTGVSPGEATITATAGSIKATKKVVVSGYVISASRTYVAVSGTLQLTVTAYGDAPKEGFVWKVDNTRYAVVAPGSGLVQGVSEGSVTITVASSNGGFPASIQLDVVRNEASSIDGYLSGGSMSFGTLLQDFTSGCQSLLGNSLSYLTNLSVSASQGTLYYGYISEADTGSGVAVSDKFYVGGRDVPASAQFVSSVTFVPKADFTGTAVIAYTGFSGDGLSYTGEIRIRVTSSDASEISYTVTTGESLTFRSADFSSYCYTVTGRSVNYVMFSPPANRYGTLYYNYSVSGVYESMVFANTRYFRTANPSLDRITFVPNDEFEGSFTIPFTMYDSSGAPVSGSVRINVLNPSGGKDAALTYTVQAGQRVHFDLQDFMNACYDATGYNLSYLNIDYPLPSSTYGTLYCGNNNRANTTTKYSVSGASNLISNLNFLAAKNVEGTAIVGFTGFNTRGSEFYGVVRVEISSTNNLSYTVKAGQRVYFEEDDFAQAAYEATGYGLNYIRLDSLPSYYQGTLYVGSATAALDTAYNYRAGSGGKLIRDLCFVASSGYTGTFTIPFTGYDAYGASFTGEITVEVTAPGSTITYKLYSGQRLNVNKEDFSAASYEETGYALNYIRFTSLPTSSQGTLYSGTSTRVSTGSTYSYSTLGNINFRANSTFTGDLELPFTGVSTHGTSFSGVLVLNVDAASAAKPVYYETTGPAVPFRASDFSAALADALSDNVSTIKFTAPGASTGSLYVDYASPFQHSAFSASTAYSLLNVSRLFFVPKAEYSGVVYVNYTATDASSNTCTGSVRIQASVPTASVFYNDLGNAEWAVQAVDYLSRYGILKGGDNGYDPFAMTRRCDFILMLSRAFSFPNASAIQYSDVSLDDYYGPAIAGAQAYGILDAGDLFYPLSPISRQDAFVYLFRCLEKDRGLKPGTRNDLAGFNDRDQVADYAVGAMGALVKLGVVQGGTKALMPTDDLVRAQMATILYRIVAG